MTVELKEHACHKSWVPRMEDCSLQQKHDSECTYENIYQAREKFR